MFNLDFRDVTGLGRGYAGKSPFGYSGERKNDYFHVLTNRVAYCRIRELAYTPETAALIAEGERDPWDPGGTITSKDKFIIWRHVRERSIVKAKIPYDALVHYAFSNDLIVEDNVFERVDKYNGSFFPPADVRRKTLKQIDEEYDFEILWEKYDDLITNPDKRADSGASSSNQQLDNGGSGSGGQEESSSGQSGGNREQQSAGASGNSERATSNANESKSSADESRASGIAAGGKSSDDDDDTEAEQSSTAGYDESLGDTHNVEEGVATSKLIDGYDEEEKSEQDGPGGGATNGSAGEGTTNFQTYKQPDLSTPGIDVDANAVAQFIDHHTTTESEGEETFKTPTDTMIGVFTEWAEMNGIDLDKLDSDLPESNRKGSLTQILKNNFDIEKDRRRFDGSRQYVYYPISVDNEIKNLM